jgi:DNA-binding beta-propeller fold protein YncE
MGTNAAPRPAYAYCHTIGVDLYSGRGFRDPVDLAKGPDGTVYVLQRGTPFHKNVLIKVCGPDQGFIREFGDYGSEEGQWVWPACIIMDSDQRLYVSDEWNHKISIFDTEGSFLDEWGEFGDGQGQLNSPCGMALDLDGHILVVDTLNHRVQRFSTQGQFLAQWGSFGESDGQFNMPWGVSVSGQGDIYITDWRNDRVQKFDSSGCYLSQWGASGSADGQFDRPAGIAVDGDGLVYVADWGNDRVQIFNPDGEFLIKLLGDATLSTWGVEQLKNFPVMVEERQVAKNLETEKLLSRPRGINIDQDGRIFVVDPPRGRVQVYRKER